MVNHQTHCNKKHNKIKSQYIRILRNKRPKHYRLQRPLQKRRHNRIHKTNKDYKSIWTNNDNFRQLQIPPRQTNHRNSQKTKHRPHIPTPILTTPKPHRIHMENNKKRNITIIHQKTRTTTKINRKTLQKQLLIPESSAK